MYVYVRTLKNYKTDNSSKITIFDFIRTIT